MKVKIGKYKKKGQSVKVKLDSWDSWNADYTLALIIYPVLKQLRKTKHGWAILDDDDGFNFEERGISADSKKRWNEVMDAMIWSFKHIVKNKEFDKQGFTEYHARIDRGLVLFGKYYRHLWD
jgi:hypothetical protein